MHGRRSHELVQAIKLIELGAVSERASGVLTAEERILYDATPALCDQVKVRAYRLLRTHVALLDVFVSEALDFYFSNDKRTFVYELTDASERLMTWAPLSLYHEEWDPLAPEGVFGISRLDVRIGTAVVSGGGTTRLPTGTQGLHSVTVARNIVRV